MYIPTFLSKLFDILENEGESIISWGEGGKGIVIHDQIAMQKKILPKYYRHCNFSSFTRQLNMYSFRKIRSIQNKKNPEQRDKMVFSHDIFQKGQRDLLYSIKRRVPPKQQEAAHAENLLAKKRF